MDTGLGFFPRWCRVRRGAHGIRFLTDADSEFALSLPELQATLFSYIRGARPLGEHAETLLATDVPGMNTHTAVRLLEDWVKAGLLLPEPAAEEANAQNRTVPDGRENLHSAYACLTAGRDGALARWKQAQNLGEGTNHQLFVFDDAHTPQATGAQEPRPVTTIDRARREGEASRIPTHLHQDGVPEPEELLRFLLLGQNTLTADLPTTGANRNSALLLSGAEQLICSDDDILPFIKHLPRPEGAMVADCPVLFGAPLFDTVFAPDLEALSPEMEEIPSYDAQNELAHLLGPIRLDKLDLSDAPAESLAILRRPGCSVHAVSIGCYGARQYSHPFRTFLSRSEHVDDILYDRASFEKLRVNPLVARHVSEPTIDTGIAFSTALCAIDVRNPRLPFFPLGRKEDDNYRTLYRICFPEQLFASLPVAAFHDPQYKQPFTDDVFNSYPMDIGAWTHMLTQRFARRLRHSDGAGRLREMALSFEEFAMLTPEQMRRFLTPLHHAHYQAMINHIQGELEVYADPPWWVDERRHALAVLQREQSGGLTETDEELAEYAEIYRLWGASLRHWPEIVQIARRERD